MPIRVLGMWLFLASEAMFFVGMLGSFVVLESAADQHQVFVHSSQMLSKSLGICGVVLLLISSLLIRKKWIALAAATGFLLLQWVSIRHLHAGPSDNNFFACFFLFTVVHCLHLMASMIALVSCRDFSIVQIYWHFVNALGVMGFVVLYFV